MGRDQRSRGRYVAPGVVPFVYFGCNDLDPLCLELGSNHFHPRRQLFRGECRRVEVSGARWALGLARSKIGFIPDRHGIQALNLGEISDRRRPGVEARLEQEPTLLCVAVALALRGWAKR